MEATPRRKNGSTLHTLIAREGCGNAIAPLLEFSGSDVWDKPGQRDIWSV